MPTVEFKIEGLDKLKDLLTAGRTKMRDGIKQAMYQHAEEVMAASKEIVPMKTGALMNTGKVMPPVETRTSISVDLGYGDEAVDYALIVHEELDSPKGNPIHWTRPGSGPKFLERPFNEKSAELPQKIVDAVKAAFVP